MGDIKQISALEKLSDKEEKMSVDTKESVTEIGDMEDNKTKVKDGGSSDAVMEGKQEDKISSYEKDEGEQKVATELSDPSDTFKLTEDRDVKDQVIQISGLQGQQERSD